LHDYILSQSSAQLIYEYNTKKNLFGDRLSFTAITDQTNHKRFFESVASQHFQKIFWFGFERKAL